MRKSTVITTLALALTIGVAGTAAAQYGAPDSGMRRGPGGRGNPEAMLLRGITLSSDQQARVDQMADARRKEMEAQRAARGDSGARSERERGDTTGMGARRAEMERRRDAQIASLRAILTDDQRVQFDKNVAELKARMAERGGMGFGRPDRNQ